MKMTVWSIALLMTLACSMSDVLGQEHNVAYYTKISESRQWTTYQLTHSLYLATIIDEPVYPNDVVVHSCSVDSVSACIERNEHIKNLDGSGASWIKKQIEVRGIQFENLVMFPGRAEHARVPGEDVAVLRDIGSNVVGRR